MAARSSVDFACGDGSGLVGGGEGEFPPWNWMRILSSSSTGSFPGEGGGTDFNLRVSNVLK
jgi:hypothetical protein